MTPDLIASIAQDAFITALWIGAPPLGAALVIGLGVGLLQAVTQINEMTLTFVPKIVAIGLVLLLTLPWMLNRLTDFTIRLMDRIPGVVG